MSNWQRKGESGERWTESEGRAAIAAWRASAENMASFARRHGLDRQRVGWWRKRLAAEEGSSLVPVTITSGRSPRSEASALRVEVDGVELEVFDPGRVPASWLVEIITKIRGAS